MEEKTKVVVTSRTRRTAAGPKEFAFSQEEIPANGALADYRRKAWEVFQRQNMPVNTEEAWRRTDLRSFPAEAFRLPEDQEYQQLSKTPAELLKPLVGDKHGGQIVIVPGGAFVELDESLSRQGVVFTDLKTAEITHPDLVRMMAGKAVNPEEGKFASLAAAFSQNGVVLYVPKGVQVDEPLHSVVWGPGSNLAHLTHLLVLVDEGASATFVHESASPTELNTNSMHAGLVEIQVKNGASLRFVELQSWGKQVWNFSHERVRVERDATLDWIFGAIGSGLTKNFSELDLAGEGASGRMSGFYFTNGAQHLDHDTQQNHLAPNTTSDLLFKGALEDKSRSVWQGMIYVAPGAQKTDGYQANRNLVLSRQARADSIPGLEILADDVRCTHGATVGRIEEEPMFYLQSRGIERQDAERLIVEGFFDPIMQRIPFEGVRERFKQAIMDKMAREKN